MIANTSLHALNDYLNSKDEWGFNNHGFGLSFKEALAIGITTVEEAIEHGWLAYAYYDGYKAVHGIKARWVNYNRTPIAELERMNAQLDAEWEVVDAEEKARAAAAEVAHKAEVDRMIDLAGDRETALRWIAEAEEFQTIQCVEHMMWNAGLLFSEYGKAFIAEMDAVVQKFDMYKWK